MADFMANELEDCFASDSGWVGLNARSMDEAGGYPIPRLSTRALVTIGNATSLSVAVKLLYLLLTTIEDGNAMLTAKKLAWDSNVTPKYPNLAIHILRLFLVADIAYKFYSSLELSGLIPCNMDEMNNVVGRGANTGNSSTSLNRCSQFAWTEGWNPDFFASDQDYADSQSPSSKIKKSVLTLDHVMYPGENVHILAKRDGAPRSYTVNLGTDPGGNPIIIIIVSWAYPNGQNGQAFVESTGNYVRYTLEDPGNCASAAYIQTANPEAVPNWVVEHVFELQTVARAKANANHLVLMDAVGNNLKGKGWDLASPVGDSTWIANGYNSPVPANGYDAVAAIRGVLGVMNYLAMPAINSNLHAVIQALHASMLEFQTIFNQNSALHQSSLSIMPIWDEGVEAWWNRMDFFMHTWISNRIQQLRTVWVNVRETTTDPDLRDTATEILLDLNELQIQVDSPNIRLSPWRV
ncbi:hypothetical protein VF21_00858 [Pseudogymnoascus sp. 05NY08]|nr:hypothetical protein VF21_00858 [Pseudogymnoascus sp. 05NY08]